MSPFLAELTGTALILIFGGGVVANVVLNKTKGNNSGWIVITFGWAIGVYTGVLVSAEYSGAHLNPAITLALALVGNFPFAKVAGYVVAQLIGACSRGRRSSRAFPSRRAYGTPRARTTGLFCTAPNI